MPTLERNDKMSYKVDFHIHTNYSDGTQTPTEIVKQAKALEYDMISITDHDGVDGVHEAMIAGEALELQVVPGVEIATVTEDDISLHILGYYIDIKNHKLTEALQTLRENRHARNEKMLRVLKSQGYDLKVEDLISRQGENYIGKPNIARALVKLGAIKTEKEAFEKGEFLGSKEAMAVKKTKIQTKEAIQVIKEAGGMAVLAHPIQIKEFGRPGCQGFYEKLDLLIKELKTAGLKGIECYHKDHSKEECLKFVEIAEKYHLHITTGSDCHGRLDMEQKFNNMV